MLCNALTAGVAKRAEHWRWGSLWVGREGRAELRNWLAPWPVARRRNWVDVVNAAPMPRELERVGLEHTVRPEGRPKAERPGG